MTEHRPEIAEPKYVPIPDWYCTDSARGEGWGSRGDECEFCERYMFDGTESVTEDAWAEHYYGDHGFLSSPPEQHGSECRRFADGHYECPVPHVNSPPEGGTDG